MTRKKDIEKTKVFLINFFIISSVFFISVFYMPYIAKFINDGLQLCRKTIIASVFPFMIFTDLIISFCRFDTSEKLKNLFSYIFKINGSGITAFICGNVCGAPMGIKGAVMLYNNGSISKSECERLIGISNNISPSFAIGGIGGLIRGSIEDGVIVYISVLLASIFTGWFFGLGKSTSKEKGIQDPAIFRNRGCSGAYRVRYGHIGSLYET